MTRGDTIISHRTKLGLTQTKFAKKCEINKDTLGSAESDNDVSKNTLHKIANFLLTEGLTTKEQEIIVRG